MTTKDIVSIEQVKYKRGKHPNSLKNLRPRWKLGQSGNPHGQSLSAELKRALDKPLKEPPEDAPARDLLIYSTLEGAILREPTPFKEVWDRLEGKVPGDQPLANQDNRVVNIYVSSDKAKELMGKVAERLQPPASVENNHGT